MNTDANILQIGDLILDPHQGLLSGRGEQVALSGRTLDLLLALIHKHPEPLRVDEAIDTLWAGSTGNADMLDQRVRQLRKVLGDTGRRHRYIEGALSDGYRLVPEPRPIAGAQRTNGSRRAWFSGLGIASIAGVFVGAVLLRPSPSPPSIDLSSPGPDEYVVQAYQHLDQDRSEDHDAAIALFRRALDVNPDYCPALSGLSLALSQSVSRFNASPEKAREAEQLARRVLARDDEGYMGYLALAASFDAQGAADLSIEAYEKARDRRPDHLGIASSLAYLLMHQGRLADSLAVIIERMQAEPAADVVLQVGQLLAILGHADKAEELLLRAHALQPGDEESVEALAWFYFKSRRHDAAAQIVANALEEGVNRAELHYVLGLTAIARGDLITAAAIFRQGLNVDPMHDDMATSLLLSQLAEGAVSQSDVRKHCDDIRQSIEAGDSWPGKLLMLASVYAQTGELDRAVSTLSELIDGGYTDVAMLRSLPWILPLHGHGEFESRIAILESHIDGQRRAAMNAKWWSDIVNEP